MEYISTWRNDRAGLFRNEYEFKNNKSEKITVWISNTPHERKNKRGLMNLWIKAGYLPEFIPETLCVETYVYDKTGNCRGAYNPQIIPGMNKIDFAWMLENTAENINRILAEIERRANA